jgi:hypothetical protein
MSRLTIGLSLAALLFSGCASSTIDAPYESCTQADGCSNGTACLQTTLPAGSGFTGELCTTGCNTSQDCLQDLSNYAAICVNAQCYIQCPSGGSTCPYGTGCLQFSDQNGDAVNLCTP